MSEIDEVCERLRAHRAEADRLLAEAKAAHRTADRERARARKLAERLARRVQYTLAAGRTQLDADRQALDARAARFDALRSDFHAAAATDRDRLRDAWSDLAARRKRLADEWDEANRFQAEQAAALDARAAELAARESGEAEAKTRLQREVTALREEAAGLDVRVRNARQVVDELEHQRAAALVPVAAGPEPLELRVALDRAGDRDLTKWAHELAQKEERIALERAALAASFAAVARDKSGLGDQRRVIAEQLAQLAAARAGWQVAERATVLEMEQLARTLRHRETELDAREQRLSRADGRRRDDAYDLWQLRLRLEAWQTKLVAFEVRWHTERERLETELARREDALAAREARLPGAPGADAIPFAAPVPDAALPAIPAELSALRDEVERMAALLLETDLPEPPDAPESELPWGTEEARQARNESDADIVLFEPARAA